MFSKEKLLEIVTSENNAEKKVNAEHLALTAPSTAQHLHMRLEGYHEIGAKRLYELDN